MGKEKQWKFRWKNWIRPTRLPGVWERKEGGYLVRARALDRTTGRIREVKRVLPDTDEATAYRVLTDELARVRRGIIGIPQLKTRFAEFAASLYERKVKGGEIRSARGRDKWATILDHIIDGSIGRKSGVRVAGLGEFYTDALRVAHVEEWRAEVAMLIEAGDYKPTTCNGWLAVLRVIVKAAKRELNLGHLATDGVKDFDESEHATYTEEEPNSLLPEEVPHFLSAMRAFHPQHFAMTFLGLATGLRPSSLRPLRRKGETPDIVWEGGRVLVRRSHSQGIEVMNTTKQRVRYHIQLPAEVVDVLRWHVETQLTTHEQLESNLLFPSLTGGFRALSVLNKPFADVAEEIKLGKRFTQRGLRRTFNDLARAAEIEAVITRSISGHLTERMQHHYSTVNANEQQASIAKVIRLFDPKPTAASGAPAGAPASDGGAPKEKAG